MAEVTFADRVGQLREREPEAVAWMYRTYRGDIDRCFGRRSPEDRSDLVQDVFETALKRIHTFQGEREATLLAWLRSIAFHRWHHRWEADQVRARHAGPSLELLLEANPSHPALGDHYSDPLDQISEADNVAAVMARLTPGQARAVRAHVIEGLSTAEIAARWGVPRERVRGLYKRGISRLRTDEWRDRLSGAA